MNSTELYDDYIDALEYDEAHDDFGERVGGRRFARRPRFRRPVPAQGVTMVATATDQRVDEQQRQLSNMHAEIKALHSSSKGVERQRKDVDARIQGLQQTLLLTTLLGQGDKTLRVEDNVSVETTDNGPVIPAGAEIRVERTGDKLEQLLPVLLLAGNTSSSDGMLGNPLALILLVKAMED